MGGQPTSTARREGSGLRSMLAGITLVLASLTIVVAVVALWVHQVALDTDRFTDIAAEVVDEPALIEPVAAAVSEQVVTALDVEERIANQLPDPATRLAAPMSTIIEDAITRRLETALANPRVQAGMVRTLSFSHAHLVDFLRGDTTALTVQNGYLYLNVFPIIDAALAELRSMGLLPEDARLPDLSTDEAPGALADRLESSLGITVPPDFGTIRLMPVERLAAAQSIVQIFDVLVVAIVVLAIALVVLAVLLARRRRRMLVFVALATVIALAVSSFAISRISAAALAGIADEGILTAMTAVVDVTVEDLIRVMTLILIATGIVAIVAYLAGRPQWLSRSSSRGAMTGAAAGTAESSAPTGGKDMVERLGVAAIVFALVWIVLGLQVALLGAALIGAWLLLVRVLAGRSTAGG